MKTKSMDNITRAFKRYSSERFPIAKGAVVGSRSFGRFLNVQGRLSDFIHKISFSRVPPWLLRMATDKLHLNRPQLTYLPMVPDRGAAKAHKQDYSPKYLARMANERQRASSSEASLVATAATANGISNSNATSFEKHHEPHGQFKQQQQQQQQQPQRFAPGEEGQEEGEHYRVGARRQRPRSKSHHHPRSPTSSIFSSKEILPPIGAPLSPSSSRKMSPRSLVPPPLPLEAPPRHHPTVYLHHHAPSSSRSSSSQTSPYSSSYSLAATTSPGVEEGYFSHHSSRSRRNTVGQNGRSQPSSPRAGVPPLAPFASLPIPFETLSRSPDVYAHGATTTTTTMTCTPPRSPTNATNYSERVTALLNRPSTTPIAPLTGPMAPTMTSASTPSTPIAASFKRRHMRTKSLHLEDNESLMAEILALERTTAMMKERALLREKRSLDQINTQWRQQQQYYQRLRHQHSHPLQQQQQQQQDQQQHQTQLRQPQPLSYHKLQQQRAELEQSSQL
ncbi:hypothetical protein BCR41DRAFT_18383 [Lobosporangium transversale]|uniref:Uncharacterized protein n=1 Tax=Lobosporangium transversale TaxID=64571 RepID=A0A1Y2GV70_9FUNG|nr:hypothetical protein BCR41DRAFT_18383 [Lobosporangium transversale]ORZ22925.1 hypothetical protein BCR41DRAFT_18383 [Lobosporangium transversale]|eukprot:XP_021883479.1 hypothetical protein BCR41DRAFT_18383 [Lobosporangium transversale]